MATQEFITALLAQTTKADLNFPIRQLNSRCIGSGYSVTYIERGHGKQRRMILELTPRTQPIPQTQTQSPSSIPQKPPTEIPHQQSVVWQVTSWVFFECDAYTHDLSLRNDEGRVEGEFTVEVLRIFKTNFQKHIEIKWAEARSGLEHVTQAFAEGGKEDKTELDLMDVQDQSTSTLPLRPKS